MSRCSHALLLVGISSALESRGVGGSGESLLRIDLPPTLDKNLVSIVQKDLGLLAEVAAAYPDDFVALRHAALNHDFGTAPMVDECGPTEEEFLARGGRQVGIALGILAGLVVLAVVTGTHTGGGEHVPAPETSPPPEAPITDAGADTPG